MNVLLIGFTVSTSIPSNGMLSDLKAMSLRPKDVPPSNIQSRSAIYVQTCTAQELRAFHVAMNEVAIWSIICYQKLHEAPDFDMSLVWSVFRYVPQSLESRLLIHRRYGSLIRETASMVHGHVRFTCGRDDWIECRGGSRLMSLNEWAQTITLVRGNLRFCCRVPSQIYSC